MQDWLDAYGESHQDPRNKAFHWICVPAIFVCVVGLFSLIPVGFISAFLPHGLVPYIHFGTLVVIFGLFFYARLSPSMAVGMFLVSSATIYLVKVVNHTFDGDAWLVFIITFAIAWIGQFIGHHIEGKKPSFLQDLQFLMIGPAWLLGYIYRKLGLTY